MAGTSCTAAGWDVARTQTTVSVTPCEIELQVINVQDGNHGQYMDRCEKAVRELVEMDNVSVLSDTAVHNIGLHRLLTQLTNNTYRGHVSGLSKEERREAKRRYEYKRLTALSYVEGIVLRLKSEHHLPMEQLLTGSLLYRAGISRKGWEHLCRMRVIPALSTVKDFISRFIERPLSMPARGRIGLAVYDNCSYKRTFMYQRVGQDEKNTINTCTLFEIPIGDLIDFDDQQPIWHLERQDIADTFNPNSLQTGYDKSDIACDMLRILESGHKVWEYPKLRESERTYQCSCALSHPERVG